MAKRKQVISHHDFVRDLRRGARGEDVAQDFFEDEFGVIAENVSKRNPDFDLKITEILPTKSTKKKSAAVNKKALKKIFKDSFGYSRKDDITIEVKYDEAAARYKNFFIEMFFNIDDGTPGTTFKCKADVLIWIVPLRKHHKIYLFKRPEFLAWIFDYMLTNKKKLKYKVPGISPHARGIPVPIKEIADSFACLGEFEYKA